MAVAARVYSLVLAVADWLAVSYPAPCVVAVAVGQQRFAQLVVVEASNFA